MPSGGPRKSWRGKKITCNFANGSRIEAIVLGPRASLKSRRLACGKGLNCTREFGARRWLIVVIRIAVARNWTIIKGVLKSFLMVYEEALLGNDLERGGVQ